MPGDLTSWHPDIPWAQLKAFRNIVVHNYWNVDMQVLWDIIRDELEPLRLKVEERVAAGEEE